MTERLDRTFYARSARTVAVDLLGKTLVRMLDGVRLAGIIVETEAYCDAAEPDLACHGDRANKGRPTGRTQVMFGQAGHAFVYFTYGMHWMFNVVTGQTGEANGVLIRALEPVDGVGVMAELRQRPLPELTNGPAKLAQALAIDKQFNGLDLCAANSTIWLENGPIIDKTLMATGPRVGMGKTPEPWYSIPWRYWINGNIHVSCPH